MNPYEAELQKIWNPQTAFANPDILKLMAKAITWEQEKQAEARRCHTCDGEGYVTCSDCEGTGESK